MSSILSDLTLVEPGEYRFIYVEAEVVTNVSAATAPHGTGAFTVNTNVRLHSWTDMVTVLQPTMRAVLYGELMKISRQALFGSSDECTSAYTLRVFFQ